MKKRILQAILGAVGVAAVQIAMIEGIPEWVKVLCTAAAGVVGMIAPKPGTPVADAPTA